jgi:hypothetical protein
VLANPYTAAAADAGRKVLMPKPAGRERVERPPTKTKATLVVCPISLLEQWRQEIRKCAGERLRVFVYYGEARDEGCRVRLEDGLEVNVLQEHLERAGDETEEQLSVGDSVSCRSRDADGDTSGTSCRVSGRKLDGKRGVLLSQGCVQLMSSADIVLTTYDMLAQEAAGHQSKPLRKYAMLCYAMLCCAVLCCAVLCYAMLCYAMLCYAMLCYAMLCYAMPCHAMLC